MTIQDQRSVTTEAPITTDTGGLSNRTTSSHKVDVRPSNNETARRIIVLAAGLIQIVDSSSHGPSLLTDFGVIAVGGGADRTLTLQNIGGGDVSGMSFAALALPFSSSGGTCGTSLAMGASCTVAVHFAPTAAGDSSASLAVTYNDGSATQSSSRTLAGHAARPPLPRRPQS